MKRASLTLVLIVALCTSAPALVAAAGSLSYTAFGDSIAFGAFALPGHGYVPLYSKAVAIDNGVFVNRLNLGVPTWTSGDLRAALGKNAVFRLAAFSSQVITVNVGGSDLNALRSLYKQGTCGGVDNEDCLRAGILVIESNWDAILNSIRALRKGRPTVIRAMDFYNPFVNEDKATDTWPVGGDGTSDFAELKPYLDELNTYITASSMAKGALVAPVSLVFNGPAGDEDAGDKGLLAFDHFHPNDRGHAAIASLLRGLGYSSVTP